MLGCRVRRLGLRGELGLVGDDDKVSLPLVEAKFMDSDLDFLDMMEVITRSKLVLTATAVRPVKTTIPGCLPS